MHSFQVFWAGLGRAWSCLSGAETVRCVPCRVHLWIRGNYPCGRDAEQ